MASPPQIYLLHQAQAYHWKACHTIRNNLIESYKYAFSGGCRILSYRSQHLYTDLYEIAIEIKKNKPQIIVILDNIPHPLKVLLALSGIKNFNSKIIIHTYGDFSLRAREWIVSQDILKENTVKFVGASTAQVELLKKFIGHPKDILYIPFPINEKTFNFDQVRRLEAREKLGIPPDEFIGIYSGRISLQKNLHLLLPHLPRMANFRFFIAGQLDHLDAPQFGWKYAFFDYFHRLQSGLDSKTRFVGHLETDDLRDLYLAADRYYSLSLHHDEDFGLSPAEAMCTGLPVTLSSWGGFHDHLGIFHENQAVPVRLTESGLSINPEILTEVPLGSSPETRKQNSKIAIDQFSIPSVATNLHEKICQPDDSGFSGFTHLMMLQAAISDFEKGFYREGSSLSSPYGQIYKVYANG